MGICNGPEASFQKPKGKEQSHDPKPEKIISKLDRDNSQTKNPVNLYDKDTKNPVTL